MANVQDIPGMSNPSLVLLGAYSAEYVDRPIPTKPPPPLETVVVRIAYTGVCGTDVHFWRHGGVRRPVDPRNPTVMGHEASGVIVAIGGGGGRGGVPQHASSPSPSRTDLRIGDQVALEPGHPCGLRCDACKEGRYNLCADMVMAAAPPRGHGTLCRTWVAPSAFCHRLPAGVGLRAGALAEPLAVAVHAVRLGGVRPGDRVVVFGAGTVGLFCAAVAREFGARAVVCVDVLSAKLEVAARFVGPAVGRMFLVPGGGLGSGEIAERMREQFALGAGADVVIDASGAEASIQTGVHVLRPGGVYVQAGMGKKDIGFPIMQICIKEITMKGSFRYGPGDFKLGLEFMSQGRIQPEVLISKVFPFEQAIEAWEATGRGEGIKNLIQGPEALNE